MVPYWSLLERCNNLLPNFIIAGGVATGTSFLSHAIKNHPDIYLPKVMRPECGFFYKSWEYKKGLDYYSERWFSEVTGQKAVGERSSLYIHGDFLGVAKRIRESIPEVKLVFCLRNPTERAFANYRFSVLSGFEHLSFEKALALENSRFRSARGWKAEIQPNLYRYRGDYERQLTPFLELFPIEQLLFIKSESLSNNTKFEISNLYKFLEVGYFDYENVESFPAYSVKSRIAQVGFRKLFREKMDYATENTRSGSRGNSLVERLVRRNLKDSKLDMSSSSREYLNDFYQKSNLFVSQLTGWELDDWK